MMKKILVFCFLICNDTFAKHIVPLFEPSIENKSIVDSMLECCETYMNYEYGNLKTKKHCFMFVDFDMNSFYFSVQENFWNDTPFLQNLDRIKQEGRLFFYDYNSMIVLIEIWPKNQVQIESRDSIEILTNDDALIYFQLELYKKEDDLEIVYYNNYKYFLEPNESRIYQFRNDTCFTLGKNTNYPFELPIKKDSSIIYLNYEESQKYMGK